MALPFRDERRPARPSWATWTLIGACLIAFAFLQPKPMQGLVHGVTVEDNARAELQVRHFKDRWALIPCELTHGKSLADGVACDGYPPDHPESYAPKNVVLPVFTSLFLHANLFNLLANLLFIWVFGRGLEDRLGVGGVLALFIAGGMAASLGFVAFHPEGTDPLLGATGAIAALMGAYLVLLPGRRILSMVYSAGLQFVYLPAWTVLGFFLLSQLLTDPSSRDVWKANVAGMAFGAAVAGWLRWRDPELRDVEVPQPTVVDVPAMPSWPSELPPSPPT